MGWIHRATPTRYEVTYKDGRRTRTLWRRKDRVQFSRSGKYGKLGGPHKNWTHPSTANPDDPVKRAARMSELFNGRPPKRVTSVNVTLPKALVHIGPCAQIDYVSGKFDGKKRQYYHVFEGQAELYAAADPMPDGRTLLMILGDFEIKPEGITG
jgi:hypothetical protein